MEQLGGTWDLEVSTPFGKYPATLVLETLPGGGYRGHIDSRLGSAALSDILQTPDGLTGTVALDLKGNTYTAQVTAKVVDDRIDGQFKVNNIPFAPPARFTGTKKAVSA